MCVWCAQSGVEVHVHGTRMKNLWDMILAYYHVDVGIKLRLSGLVADTFDC